MTNDTAHSRSDFRRLAVAAARLADAKKAEAIAVYDVSGRSPLADFLLVATADNPAHLEAVEEEISVNFKKEGLVALHRDGARSGRWRVLDYGGVIIHLFERQARETFAFDAIYAAGAGVKWEKAAPGKTRAKSAAPRTVKKAARKTATRRKPSKNKKR